MIIQNNYGSVHEYTNCTITIHHDKVSETSSSSSSKPDESAAPQRKQGAPTRVLFSHPSAPNQVDEAVAEREKRRLLGYLASHKMRTIHLTTSESCRLNQAIACFVECWKQKNIIQDWQAPALLRFLKDCGLQMDVEPKTWEGFFRNKYEKLKECEMKFDIKSCFN